MDHETGERALRVAGLEAPGAWERLDRAVRAADHGARLRRDEATDILHVTTGLDALELDALLTRAGFDVTAVTG